MIRMSDDGSGQMDEILRVSVLYARHSKRNILASGYDVKSTSGAGSNTKTSFRSSASATILRRHRF
jgi:hypothetical protein